MFNQGRSNFLRREFPVAAWGFLIFLGSSLPTAQVSGNSLVNFVAHKLVHFCEYSLLYLLSYRSLVDDFWQLNKNSILKAMIFVSFFSLLDEYHQSFVPGRQARLADVVIDLASALIALSLWQFSRQRKLQKLTS